ncbi:hypothetical protein CROQUDRAFT_662212, partial [Cronartium quercuum f. sp. fusiforme G11]
MIRPRVGSFVYLSDEVETMLAEIWQLRKFVDHQKRVTGGKEFEGKPQRDAGVQGIVAGALNSDGGVDTVT